MNVNMTPLQKAIWIAGSQSKLGKMLGVTPQAVQRWNSGKNLPITRAIQIEEVLQHRITRYDLLPDVFPLPLVLNG